MPIYEYRCTDCGFQDEYLQKVTEPQLTVCPGCGKETFKKLLSAAGFQLKGSGWYATDFRNSGSKPAKSADSESGAGSSSEGATDAKAGGKSDTKSEGKSEGKSESKSDSKPESKPESKPGSSASSKAGTPTSA